MPQEYHSLQVAWVRSDIVVSYDRALIEDMFLETADSESIVGSAQFPAIVGMRVRFVDRFRFLEPVIFSDSGGGPGTISWVSP